MSPDASIRLACRSGMLLLIASLTIGCTKRNPDLCCTTDAECAAIGFSSHAPCDLGVCVKNECTTATNSCDDDTDCPADSHACVAGTCAVCAISAACPASAPVCDAGNHDCRTCVSDEECDSGACDLGGGTCVDPIHIRYASPTGDNNQPCSRTQPCSFLQASATVDTDHQYIVLLPGTHEATGIFVGKSAIVCGHDAKLEPKNMALDITNGSHITIRGFEIALPDRKDHSENVLIRCNKSSLILQDMTILITAPSSDILDQEGVSLTVQRSTLQGGRIIVSGTDVEVDRSNILGKTSLLFTSDGQSLTVTNSVFELANLSGLSIRSTETTFNAVAAFIEGNTFENGQLYCGANQFLPVTYQANIFHNTKFEDINDNPTVDCNFTNNLISSTLTVSPLKNQVGDPHFVNAADHDYHLQPTSPARDAATTLVTNHDHDGVLRPQGVRSDIGAFEYHEPN